MSNADTTTEEFLAALEAKVERTIALVKELRAERRKLADDNAELKRQIESSATGGEQLRLRELEAQLADIDGERTRLLADRKAMTRRMEDVLARLEFLESESAAH